MNKKRKEDFGYTIEKYLTEIKEFESKFGYNIKIRKNKHEKKRLRVKD